MAHSTFDTGASLHSSAMTVSGGKDQKAGATSRGDEEEIPSYQEATTGASSSSAAPPAPASAQAGGGAKGGASAAPSNMYPFPSPSTQPNYGQSPYQADGTTRIAIVQGNGVQLLPLHATTVHRGPPAGMRFFVALFWACVLYTILGLIMGTVIEMDIGDRHPRTPPGWKHHHGHGNDRLDGWIALLGFSAHPSDTK